jgi:hypothetical protein
MGWADFSCDFLSILKTIGRKVFESLSLLVISLVDSLAGASKQMAWPTIVMEG